MQNFENVVIGNEVVFVNAQNMKQTGTVYFVDSKKFRIKCPASWKDHNGVINFYEQSFSFYKKTGTKTHSHHNNGNAISFHQTMEQLWDMKK